VPPTITAGAGRLLGAGDVLAIPLHPAGTRARLGIGADALDALQTDFAAIARNHEATGKAGEIVEVPVARDRVRTVVLLGVGDGSATSMRKAGAALARKCKSARSIATTAVPEGDPLGARAFTEGFALASYGFSRRSEPKLATTPRLKLIADRPKPLQDALHQAAVTAEAVWLARDLANTPSLEKTPTWMAEQAEAIATTTGLDFRAWDEQALRAEGFGGIVAVGNGSSRPPRLVQLAYNPAAATEHVVLVGKGITFDSGGLSLKPLDNMKAMKTDMAGSAAVLATMSALRSLGAQRKVTALLPLAENMVGGAATRPGDVVRQWGGRSVEVLNTDAEGRLVLADALAYAAATLRPDAIVDVATLTGAATLGLGRRHAPLYATSDALQSALVAAGELAGERLWPMPLVADYRDALDSPIADLRNIGDPDKGYSGGSIAAALFLREFVGDVPWAHLDIAGTGRADADDDEIAKGPTGFGVRTFLRWLATS
jgi:leucyl aminopeptidase